MVAFITRNASNAASPAVPLSVFASPTATPTAKSTDRLANTIEPALVMIVKIACNQSTSKNGYAVNVFGFDSAPPIPNNSPAAGSTAIGSMNDLPNRCAFSNHAPDEAPLNICIIFSSPRLMMKIFTIINFINENYHQKPGSRSYFFKMTGISPLLSATLSAEKRIKDFACQKMKTCC